MKNIYPFLLCLMAINMLASAEPKHLINPKHETFALVAGVSEYQDSNITNLRYAHNDAIAFAKFLRSPAGGMLDGKHLKLLLNEEATMANFAVELHRFLNIVKPGDNVILFFSGHGDVEKMSVSQPGYLLFWDAPYRVYMMGGAFALSTLQDVITTLTTVNQANILIISDTCHAGNLAGQSNNGTEVTGSILAKQYSNETKILSCQPNELSIEGKQWGGGRGAFSYHLINGLYGMADQNGDYAIDLKEIRNYLEEKVSHEVRPYSQTPMTVGNSSTHLFDVHPDVLKEAMTSDTFHNDLVDSIASRGFEEDVLEKQDDVVKVVYQQFKAALKTNRLLYPKNDCADYYYRELLELSTDTEFNNYTRRKFSAALQNNAQQLFKIILNFDTAEVSLSRSNHTKEYRHLPAQLERANQLLGQDNYMRSLIQARKLFFKGFFDCR